MSRRRKERHQWYQAIYLKNALIDTLIDDYRGEKRIFYYFRDRYALDILGHVAGEGSSVYKLKHSPYASLLHKPLVKKIIAKRGDAVVSSTDFYSYWPHEYQTYRVTFGHWGDDSTKGWVHDDYSQTSRAGKNLVLQLNFNSSHNRAYKSLIDPDGKYPFEGFGHPINGRKERTLAWARIDIDLDNSTALIEEIQSDWVRDVQEIKGVLDKVKHRGNARKAAIDKYLSQWGIACGETRFLVYYHEHFIPQAAFWPETILFAAVKFLTGNLGLSRIYLHTYDTGLLIKGMKGAHPPRSLYTQLPKKFCFTTTRKPPNFLEESIFRRIGSARKRIDLEWSLLDFTHLTQQKKAPAGV